MKRIHQLRQAYLPPVTQEVELLPMTVLAASTTEPTDWTEPTIPDGFVDIFSTFDALL